MVVNLVYSKMSVETDVHTLFQVYASLQDIMKHHDLINLTLKDISACEDNHGFATLETAAAAVIEVCEQVEKQFKPKESKCCCKR